MTDKTKFILEIDSPDRIKSDGSEDPSWFKSSKMALGNTIFVIKGLKSKVTVLKALIADMEV